MLVLAISGLLLIGVLTGTYRSIGQQRYNDAVRGVAEYLRATYSAVMNPETFGGNDADSFGSSDDTVILGKALVFGSESGSRVYSATLIGSATIPAGRSNFVDELKAVDAGFFCGETRNLGVTELGTSVSSYTPLWESSINQDYDSALGHNGGLLIGTLIVARAPSSGVIHTAFLEGETFDLKNECSPTNKTASTQFNSVLNSRPEDFNTTTAINFCVKSEDSAIIRDVRLSADGRNASAVNIIDADVEENKCNP